jgi:3-hydroxyisobutyrate dehydrogenase
MEETLMTEQTIAVLGTGTMGSGMAASLLKAGFFVNVYNRTSSKTRPLAELGARVATSPADAAKEARIIITMLADDHASRHAWLSETDGALAAAEPGTILVDSSTVSPAWIAELGAAANARGLEVLDAPVTGSRTQAETGKLTFLVGGSEAALSAVTPAFNAMGQKIVHFGPLGSGAIMKLINNFVCGVQVASLAEAIAWIERSGLDRNNAVEFLNSGAPGSPLFRAISDRMTRSDYTVNFFLELMSKDLEYARVVASEAGVPLSTAVTARSLFQQAIDKGLGRQDMSSVIEVLRSK